MRASVWTAAIVVAGLGLVVALAGWMGGEGRVTASRIGDQAQEQREPAIAQQALPAGTEIEVGVHTVMTDVRHYRIRGEPVRASRDEAAMLEDADTDGHNLDIGRSTPGHTVWFTLVNHTDDGFLISEGTLHQLLRYRVGYADDRGNAWRVQDTVLGNPDGEWTPTHTIPLAPRGRRVMTMDFGHVDFFLHAARPLEGTPPDTLRYLIEGELSVRRIVGQNVGDAELVRAGGRGECEVGPVGPR